MNKLARKVYKKKARRIGRGMKTITLTSMGSKYKVRGLSKHIDMASITPFTMMGNTVETKSTRRREERKHKAKSFDEWRKVR